MSNDKRRDPRFDAQQKLWCEGQTDVEARNISRRGMFIVSEEAREVGAQFKVSFEDAEDTIELDMEVMWCGEPAEGGQAGMGVKIVGFGRGENAYERFVERHLKTEPEGETASDDAASKRDEPGEGER